MALMPGVALTTCDIKNGWGGADRATGVLCKHEPRVAEGRLHGAPGTVVLFSDEIDLDPSVDIRDGWTRTAGSNALTYADGDEVRVPSGSSNKYVVVWVEIVNRGTPQALKRAYLLRHSANWGTVDMQA